MTFIKREQTIKKLLYQSCYRGCRETELIIGGFAKQNLNKMTEEELGVFAELIQLPDADIYDWCTRKKPIPKNELNFILDKLINFIPH